jgi:phage terminase small subunit
MAMTEKKRRFATAKREGKSNKEAAIIAGYKEETASQAGSRLAVDKEVIAEIERKEVAQEIKEKVKTEGIAANLPDMGRMYSDPKDFLMAMMNDIESDPKLRQDAAKALMPFIHQKLGEGGKKEGQQKAAEKAASKFIQAAPPKLVVANGKKI